MEQTHIDDQDQIAAIARTLMDGRMRSTQIGTKVVEFTEAKMRHIPIIIKFFNSVAQSVDKDGMTKLVKMISQRQIAAIQQGANPDDIPMPEHDLVVQAFGNLDILQHILVSVAEQLPALVASLTNVTAEEYEDMTPDHGVAVLFGIIVLNYGFFTNKIVPTLRVLLGAIVAKQGGNQPEKSSAA